jgi:dTMP kinase
MLALIPELERPDHWVIVDRYVYAHLALAEVFETGNLPLLRRLYSVYPQPDLVFFLDVDANTAAERVRRRGTDSNAVGFLDDFRQAFHHLDEFGSFRVVDAAQPAGAVFDQVWAQVRAAVPAVMPASL